MKDFEWDDHKNKRNIENHGIRFEDAIKIFDRPVLTNIDSRTDYGETREISLGLLHGIVVVMVVHTERNGRTRIISARKATKKERRRYEEATRQAPDG